jgi:hypothetical protein
MAPLRHLEAGDALVAFGGLAEPLVGRNRFQKRIYKNLAIKSELRERDSGLTWLIYLEKLQERSERRHAVHITAASLIDAHSKSLITTTNATCHSLAPSLAIPDDILVAMSAIGDSAAFSKFIFDTVKELSDRIVKARKPQWSIDVLMALWYTMRDFRDLLDSLIRQMESGTLSPEDWQHYHSCLKGVLNIMEVLNLTALHVYHPELSTGLIKVTFLEEGWNEMQVSVKLDNPKGFALRKRLELRKSKKQYAKTAERLRTLDIRLCVFRQRTDPPPPPATTDVMTARMLYNAVDSFEQNLLSFIRANRPPL